MSELLVLLSAFLHALWNALLKRYRDPQPVLVGVIAAAIVLTAIFATFTPQGWSQPAAAWGWAVVAGLTEAGYLYTLAISLERTPLSVVYPIARGGAVVLVWPAAVLWFDEAFTPLALLAAGLVLAGLVLVAQPGRDSNASSRGVAFASACAVFIAGYHLSYKLALSAGGSPATVDAIAMGIALPLNVLLIGAAGRAKLRDVWVRSYPALIGIGAICAASFLIFLYALDVSGPGEAFTLRNSSVVFAQLFALALGERPSRMQWAGLACVTLGAVLLSFG